MFPLLLTYKVLRGRHECPVSDIIRLRIAERSIISEKKRQKIEAEGEGGTTKVEKGIETFARLFIQILISYLPHQHQKSALSKHQMLQVPMQERVSQIPPPNKKNALETTHHRHHSLRDLKSRPINHKPAIFLNQLPRLLSPRANMDGLPSKVRPPMSL